MSGNHKEHGTVSQQSHVWCLLCLSHKVPSHIQYWKLESDFLLSHKPPNKPPSPGCLQQSPFQRYETRRVVKARPLLAEVLRSSLGVCGRRSRLRTWVYPLCPVPCSGRGRVGVNSTYGPQIGHWRQRHPEHGWKECDGTGWKCYEIHIKPGTIALVLSCVHTQLVS